MLNMHYHSKGGRVLWVGSQTFQKELIGDQCILGILWKANLLGDRYKMCILTLAISSWDLYCHEQIKDHSKEQIKYQYDIPQPVSYLP